MWTLKSCQWTSHTLLHLESIDLSFSFGKHWFTELHVLWTLADFIIQYQKRTFIYITTDFITEVSESWEIVKVIMVDFKFSKILTFAWKLKIYHWQQIVRCFSWNDSLSSFGRKCLPDTQLRITTICQLFFQIKSVFHEKKHECFFWGQLSYFSMQ